MKLLALVTAEGIARYLRAVGEPTAGPRSDCPVFGPRCRLAPTTRIRLSDRRLHERSVHRALDAVPAGRISRGASRNRPCPPAWRFAENAPQRHRARRMGGTMHGRSGRAAAVAHCTRSSRAELTCWAANTLTLHRCGEPFAFQLRLHGGDAERMAPQRTDTHLRSRSAHAGAMRSKARRAAG